MSAKLVVSGVSKRYDGRLVLESVDIEVAPHQVVCLIGASGSGKSTLLKCVDLLVPVDEGTISLDGEVITGSGVNANRVRAKVGIVFQSFNLFPHMSVIDNITLAPRKALGVAAAEATARGERLLERFGLAEKRDEFPERLSGGQQQRVAIIRALATEPELLLLDEITSSLDPVLVGEVLAVVRELSDQGMTMLIATHEMGFARDVADRVCFLDEGRVVEQGAPATLFADPQDPRTRAFLARISEAGRL